MKIKIESSAKTPMALWDLPKLNFFLANLKEKMKNLSMEFCCASKLKTLWLDGVVRG